MKRDGLNWLLILGLLTIAGTGVYVVMTRGFRNNNPGNLTDAGVPWVGLVGHDPDGYAIFDTLENGIRALGKDLLAKMGRGLTSVRAIITVYAPPSENPTESYIDAVSRRLGVGPNDTLTVAQLPDLAGAIINFENGHDAPSDALERGINAALNT